MPVYSDDIMVSDMEVLGHRSYRNRFPGTDAIPASQLVWKKKNFNVRHCSRGCLSLLGGIIRPPGTPSQQGSPRCLACQ